MSQSFDATTGWPLVTMTERDRSQLPLWPELESELEQALAAQVDVSREESAPDPDSTSSEFLAGASAEPDEAACLAAPALPLVLQQDPPESRASFDSPELDAAHRGEHRMDARAEAFPDADSELGQRLRAARERAALGRDEIARRTRIAPALIQAIEEGRFERLGAIVFARGYLRSYARAVDLPDAVVGVWEGRSHREVEAPPAPSLAATSSRRSSRQVASPIVYTLLTVLIAVPAYYGVRQAQQSPLMRAGISAGAVEQRASVAAPDANRDQGAASAAPAAAGADGAGVQVIDPAATATDAWRQPVMASMAPMLGSRNEAEPAPVPLDVRQVQVRLSAPSWVEIVASDGRVIERSLLPTGSVRDYAVPRSARVRIGDAGVVELRADGKVLDLSPYTHANVATLTLDEAG